MVNELKVIVKNCFHNIDANKRYVRPEEVATSNHTDTYGKDERVYEALI